MTLEAELRRQHHPDAIRARLESPRGDYTASAVLGAIDGSVTTFAIVAASVGGGLSQTVIIVLGLANLVADGFSMAVGNYNATQSRVEQIEKARRIENDHIDKVPEGEREEVRMILERKGLQGKVVRECSGRDHQRPSPVGGHDGDRGMGPAGLASIAFQGSPGHFWSVCGVRLSSVDSVPLSRGGHAEDVCDEHPADRFCIPCSRRIERDRSGIFSPSVGRYDSVDGWDSGGIGIRSRRSPPFLVWRLNFGLTLRRTAS